MKVDVIVKDLSVQEAQNVLITLGGVAVVQIAPQPTFVGAPQPTNLIQPQTQDGSDDGAAAGANHDPNDLDAAGFPWNEKIHSGNQKKTAKGLWTSRRGAPDALIAQVEADMRAAGFGKPATVSAPAAPQFPGQPSPPQIPPFIQQGAPVAPAVYAPSPLQNTLARVEEQMGIAPPAAPAPVYAPQPPVAAPVYAPAPAAAAPVAATDFNGLMTTISQLFKSGAITPEYLNTLVARIGGPQGFNVQIATITDIAGNEAMVKYAFDILRHDQKIA